jgi:hypothetical protein
MTGLVPVKISPPAGCFTALSAAPGASAGTTLRCDGCVGISLVENKGSNTGKGESGNKEILFDL